jgi:hypothetical protein
MEYDGTLWIIIMEYDDSMMIHDYDDGDDGDDDDDDCLCVASDNEVWIVECGLP